jgi:hypothetical protein
VKSHGPDLPAQNPSREEFPETNENRGKYLPPLRADFENFGTMAAHAMFRYFAEMILRPGRRRRYRDVAGCGRIRPRPQQR